jgi:uncharacterized membrane protein YgcG
MSASRSGIALFMLFGGIIALLLLRYYPWVFTDLMAYPLLVVVIVAVAVAVIGNLITRRVPDPKRAVVFRDERFDRVEPRGAFALGPGERVGAEIPLDERHVPGWPMVVYDVERKEHTIIFGLTWRLIPSAMRPDDERERRTLLMTDAARRSIVLQTLELLLRNIARCMNLADLNAVLTDPSCIEAIREGLNARLAQDALTVDRLHMLRFITPKEEDKEPRAAREWKHVDKKTPGEITVESIRGWSKVPDDWKPKKKDPPPPPQDCGIEPSEQPNGGTHNGGTHNGGTHNGGTHNGGTHNGGTHNGGTHGSEHEHREGKPCSRCGQFTRPCHICGQPEYWCGHTVAPAWCTRCGQPLIRCGECGAPVDRCTYCGHPTR